MADTKISGLTAATAAATTDEFAINQGGTSKKLTNALLFTAPVMQSYVDYTGIATPSAPGAGVLRVFARNNAGRMRPAWIGPSGLDTAYQAGLDQNNVTLWLPGTGTTAAISFGVSWTTAATQAHPTIASTSLMTAMKRATFTTTTASGNAAGVRSSAPICLRGNAAGMGGFFFAARFGILTYNSTDQIWVGLSGVSGVIAGEPSAQNDTVAMSKDSGETTWQVLTRDTSTANKVSTGRTTAAAGNTDIFDFYCFCKPNDTHIYARVVDIGSGTVLVNNTDITSNLPTNTTALYAHAEIRKSANGTAGAIFLNKIYVESDQ